jgi:diacylglycerol kinase family enzyme
MSARRTAAILSLALMGASVALGAYLAWVGFPQGLLVVAVGLFAGLLAWQALGYRGPEQLAVAALAFTAAAAATVLVLVNGGLAWFVVGAGALLSGAAARIAFAAPVRLPAAPPLRHPVLLANPRAGGMKTARHSLPDAARRRGIRVIELSRGDDPAEVAMRAADAGADALGMAGGDGSQAAVAAVAAAHGLPFVCIPAGTRNHFALDLGVDRNDVVGALDAFGEAGERSVDLATVNGRTFVNNVSLGIYADAVQRSGYRQAKIRTLMTTLAEWRRDGGTLGLRWRGPEGSENGSEAAILVSNNRYRLGRAVGSGTRPRIDEGVLGIAVALAPAGLDRDRRPQRPWQEWSAPRFEVDGDEPIPAGIDGEAVLLEPPLRFRIEHRALRVRIARRHPGASPSARLPESPGAVPGALLRIVRGPDAEGSR